MDELSDVPTGESADDVFPDVVEEAEPDFEIMEEPGFDEELAPNVVEEEFEPEIAPEEESASHVMDYRAEREMSDDSLGPDIIENELESDIVEGEFEPDIVEKESQSEIAELEQASDAKPDPTQGTGTAPGNLDLPVEARPARANTEKGLARRTEIGPAKPEVKNFDIETKKPKPPEGWSPGGPEQKF